VRSTNPFIISFIPGVYVAISDAGVLKVPSPEVVHKTDNALVAEPNKV